MIRTSICKGCTLVILPILFLCSFSGLERKVQPDRYLEIFESQKPYFQKELKDAYSHYKVSFIPREIQVIQGVKQGKISSLQAQEWLNESDSEISFLITIEIPENGNKEFLKFEKDSTTYDQRLDYYAFEFARDIQIVTIDNQTINVSDYHFERDFGLSPKGTFSVSFTKPENIKEFDLVIDDKIYGSQAKRITFNYAKFNDLPQLKKINKWKNHKE